MSTRNPIRQSRFPRGKQLLDLVLHSSIFCIGLLFFLVHFYTWVIPQWRDFRGTVGEVCIVKDTRITEREIQSPGIDPEAPPVMEYRPEIFIEYAYRGETYSVWTYEPETLADGGYFTTPEEAEEIIARFELGKEYECRFDPAKPLDAYLHKDVSVLGWCFLAIPVSLMIFGFFGLAKLFWEGNVSDEYRAARIARSRGFSILGPRAENTESYPTIPDMKLITESPGTQLAFRLPVSFQSSLEFFGAFLFCVLWNLVSWIVLIYSLYNTPGTTRDIVLCLFFGALCCGFGLYLFIRLMHRVLTIFGIGPTIVEISDHPILPGRRFRLAFTQYGSFRIKNFEVSLICEEISRFRQGTDTLTNRKEVYRQEMFSRRDFETGPDSPIQEELILHLPLGAMHSMRSEHNEILWKILVHAELVDWADLHRECPIIVHPVSLREITDTERDA